jgi:hypothetical protein
MSIAKAFETKSSSASSHGCGVTRTLQGTSGFSADSETSGSMT